MNGNEVHSNSMAIHYEMTHKSLCFLS